MIEIIVGAGVFRYKVKQFKSAKVDFGNTSDVALDSNERIYIFQRKTPPVLVFNKKGILVDSWGDDLIADVHGVFISDNDEIFVVARGVHEVLKFNSSGELLLRIGSRGVPSWQKPFNHPTDVAVSDKGDIFVTDGYGNAAVHKFLESGKHVFSWGEPGSGKGEFHTPHGIWVHKGKVYVVDRDNNRVQIFDEEGEYITEWCDFFHPMGIYMDSRENIFVTDQTPRFTVLNLHGKILSRGFSPDFGHGVWGDSSGNLYLSSNEKGVNRFIKI